MKNETCCFTGHRQIENSELSTVKKTIKKEIVALIKRGVKYFGTGGARGFDTIAAETVLKLKQKYPHIKLILIFPCLNQTKGWNEEDIVKYNAIKSQADKITVLSQEYYRGCMHKRNRFMIDNSGYCVCYCRKNTGGTAYTVDYAKKNNVTLIYI